MLKFKLLLEFVRRKTSGYFIILGFIFILALILDKFKETFFLLVAYTLTRNSFDMQLHLSTDLYCIKATCVIFTIAIIFIIPYQISVIFCSIIGILINYVCYVFMLIPFKSKNKNKRDIVLQYVKNDEEDVEKKCKELNLINMSETIYLFLNNSYEDVSAILNIETSTVRRRVDRFIERASQN